MLTVEHISKSYQQKIALENIHFEINEGEIFALLGPNGAGKSTLLRIINQIIEPNKGHLLWGNQRLTAKHLREIGYLPEERGLYRNMRVLDHGILLGRLRGMTKNFAQSELLRWMEKFDCADWANRRIEELSKGMAQKIQFIFTILHDPQLIILDEPYSGFDPLNVELMQREILNFRNQGKAILVSTHNMSSVEELADRAFLLHRGKEVLKGSLTQMKERFKTGEMVVRFRGNQIGFVTALWSDFELVETKELPDNRFEAHVNGKNGNGITELMKAIAGKIEVEEIKQNIPSMHDVFLGAIQNLPNA